jgi:inosine/xanthosine triphosphate pyrophosphatase family protein
MPFGLGAQPVAAQQESGRDLRHAVPLGAAVVGGQAVAGQGQSPGIVPENARGRSLKAPPARASFGYEPYFITTERLVVNVSSVPGLRTTW